ncbi:hypothetical protein CHS0354_020586 [Potamilus streckersoni]|uniref:Cadherin domain-containing protein n=1 Tax=Potamilus streckersoni TaxID=2493646 RepID=A0AAE0RRC3_9BIVA|nr:hypothetical protein CHS0354_020586 [Potamilus streckersoni]
MGTDDRRSIFSIYIIVIGITGFLLDGCTATPQFDAPPHYVQFFENKDTPIGTLLFLLRATDSVNPFNEMTIFTNDQETAYYVSIIQLKNTSPAVANVTLKHELDRESLSKSVRLYILDVCDEAPMFDRPSYTLEIDEINITQPLLVFREIHATDRDNGYSAVVTYKMESTYLKELYKDTFSMDPTNGSVFLLRNLDYENNSFYQFAVHSQDTCNLTADPVDFFVKVKDVQDMPPFFVGVPYYKSISEGLYMLELVLRVTAIDGDLGIPNQISYSFITNNRFCQEHFAINSSTGEVVVTGRLDWEMDEVKYIHGVCNFIVQAKEIDNHPRNQRGQTVSNQTVTVTILQSNTHEPHIQINPTITNNFQTEHRLWQVSELEYMELDENKNVRLNNIAWRA